MGRYNMSYCIAIHSDIETLKKARKILIEKGFEDDKDGDEFYTNDDYEGEDYSYSHAHNDNFIHIEDGKIRYHNHNAATNETITTTPSTLHSIIDLVIKKLKENE
jgi:hypothetical protein